MAEFLLSMMTWQWVFVVFSVLIVTSLLALPLMRSPEAVTRTELEESMGEVLGRAFRDPTYTLIFLGFFSCGYQLAFITAHFPAFVTEACGAILPGGVLHSMGITTTSALGAVAISLVGLANIAGTLTAGWAGKRYSRKYLLSGHLHGTHDYCRRLHIDPDDARNRDPVLGLHGGAVAGNGAADQWLIAHIYGLRYMGTLYGIVFFSHQLGSFLGVWLGGRMYDIYGSYTVVWWIGIGVGLFSAIVHLPSARKTLGGSGLRGVRPLWRSPRARGAGPRAP